MVVLGGRGEDSRVLDLVVGVPPLWRGVQRSDENENVQVSCKLVASWGCLVPMEMSCGCCVLIVAFRVFGFLSSYPL